jgi:UDP-3-O-[3-hydroxymyristoyl] glucosamine N-acyltransferase
MKKTLKELAEWVGGAVIGEGDVEISGVAPIEEAQPGEITFIANPKYLVERHPCFCGHCLQGHPAG